MAKKKREERPKEYTRRQLSHFQRQKRRQRLIFISGITIIVAILVIVLLGWYLNEYRPMHRTLIKVGETEFNMRYYIDALKTYQISYPSESMETLDSNVPTLIVQSELMRQAADTLGITVGDKEIKEKLKDSGQAVTDALVDVTRSQELETRLTDEYFGVQVPVSEDQVQFMALLSESESLASEARDKLMSGESFATLLEQYNQHSYAKAVEGDFGLHPRGILQGETDSAVPLDFAFGAEVGTVSPPLADNETFKSIGYWLLKVVGRPSDNSAMVQAVYLSSREEALDIKARLEAGEDLGALAEQYSQYTASKEKRGELGLIDKPSDDTTTAVSEPFDGYVFDPATELGKWSDPIADTKFSTQGGYWLVQLIDKQINADLSDEDRQTLIYKAYSDWIGGLYLQYAAEIDYSGLTSENRAWAIVRAGEELQQLGG